MENNFEFDENAIQQGLNAIDSELIDPKAGDEVEKLKAEEAVEEAPTTVDPVEVDKQPVTDNEPEEQSDTEVLETLYSAITQKVGIELNEEEMESIAFDNQAEAIAQVTDIIVQKAQTAAIENLLESNPGLDRALAHIQAYGTLDSFNKNEEVGFSFDVSSIEGQREVYTAKLLEQGLDEESAKLLVENAEDSGSLEDKATAAYSHFKAKEEEYKAQELEQAKQLLAQREAEYIAIREEGTAIINKGQIVNFALNNADRKALADYCFKPVDKEGRTQSQIDDEKLSLEQELAWQYQKMKGFKNLISGVPPVVKTLKDAFNKNKGRVSPVGGRQEGNTEFGDINIDVDKVRQMM